MLRTLLLPTLLLAHAVVVGSPPRCPGAPILGHQDAPKVTPQAAAEQEEPLEYPTFEPFSGPMWELMFGKAVETTDLRQLVADVQKRFEILKTAGDAAAKYAPAPVKGAPSAKLAPDVPIPDRAWFSTLPAVLKLARPLWEAKAWTKDEVALANRVAEFLRLREDAPRLTFADAKDVENRRQLEELVRWYWKTVERPEAYAALIFTMDDGPFAGLPFDADAKILVLLSKKLDDETEIQLCFADGLPEPNVIRCVVKGKPTWARVISDSPDQSVALVEFTDDEPTRMGRYGWKVHLVAHWAGGVEYTHLYVGPEGQFRFYYMSW